MLSPYPNAFPLSFRSTEEAKLQFQVLRLWTCVTDNSIPSEGNDVILGASGLCHATTRELPKYWKYSVSDTQGYMTHDSCEIGVFSLWLSCCCWYIIVLILCIIILIFPLASWSWCHLKWPVSYTSQLGWTVSDGPLFSCHVPQTSS